MLSESARMSSTAEARFRVQAPNSLPRQIKVVALDRSSEVIVRRLASVPWNHATFFTTAAIGPPRTADGAGPGWLSTINGQTTDLIDEVSTADLVVMVATAGEEVKASAIIGEACSHKRVTTTALIVDGKSASDEALAKTLASLRPWSLMVVIAGADDYIEDMLIALRGR